MMSNSNNIKPLTLKKSITFQFNKSPSNSMDLLYNINNPAQQSATFPPKPRRATSFGPRKSPVAEFPTSPQPLGEEIIHFYHPQHNLREIDQPDLFTCSGCKEYGSGKRFTCTKCDFQLHMFCALPPEALKNHPFHCQHQLTFYTKPAHKGGILKSRCDVCGKPIKGYNFRCSASACSFQMHPCCAMLSTEFKFPVHPHTLKLLPLAALASTNGSDPGFVCGECKRRRSGRVYRCSHCDYHLHLVCAKNMVNGLHANNIRGPEKASMFGAAARLASQVVIDFIGGLIEGLGEGMGEVIAENITRGRNNRNKQIN